MTKTNKQIIDLLYEDLMSSNRRAEEASYKYRSLSADIERTETINAVDLKLTRSDIAERIRARKEKDNELIGYFSSYSFYRGEVERINAVLQGLLAFKQLRNYSALAQGPSIPINISGQ